MNTFYKSEERLLVNGCLKQDRLAQKQLYEKYVHAVFHTCLRICGQETHAEDITQEVFVRAFNRIDSFKGESSLGAWIKQIAVHASLNHVKRYQNWLPLTEVPTLKEQVGESTIPPSEWSVHIIHNAIQKLPPGSRAVLSLYLIEGYQHKEIAQILGISVSTSKSQYHRAKRLLQAQLKTNHPFLLDMI